MRRTPASRAAMRSVEGAVDVGLVGGEGVLDGTRNRGEGCLVKDYVDAAAGFLHALDVLDVHLLERDFVFDGGEVVEGAGGEIINSADGVALFDELVRDG